MKQTVEEAARKYSNDQRNRQHHCEPYCIVDFKVGVEWQSKQSPWISVEERLPEIHQDVLVLCESHGFAHIHTSMYFGEENWKFGMSDILAWMPTPTFDQILEANKDVLQRMKEKGD